MPTKPSLRPVVHFILACLLIPTFPSGAQEKEAEPQLDVSALIQRAKAGTLSQQEIIEVRESFGSQSLTAFNQKLVDNERDVEERWFSAILMARVGGQEAIQMLAANLADDAFIVRMAAIKGLEMVGDRSILPKLHTALDDKAMVVRAAAADSLAHFADPSSLDPLGRALFDKKNYYKGRSLWVRNHIITALGRIGNKKSVHHIARCLTENELTVKQHALAALNPALPAKQFKSDNLSTDTSAKAWVEYFKNS